MTNKTIVPRRNGSRLAGAPPRLRDLIYLDFEKCASIFSQLEGGLLREMQSTSETAGDARVTGELNIGIAKLGSGFGANDKHQELQSRVLHHDVLDRIESSLAEQQLLLDLNCTFSDSTPDEAAVRQAIEGHGFYVRAEGWVMLEDYRRMTRIASSFNSLMEFLVKCATDTVKKSPEYQQLTAQLNQLKESAKAQANRDQRAMELERVKALERQLASLIEAAASSGALEDWLVNGIMQFVELFKPAHINLRVYPFGSAPGFQLLANLKERCFFDGDLENFAFAYGIKPNVRLTLLGLVTSMPPRDGPLFDPLQEFKTDAGVDADQQKAFEKGFRQVFSAFEEMEKLVRFTRYPNVTLFPIALYRTLR